VNIHEKYMARCIELAKNGFGQTYPNPMVGCVIVHNDEIISEGWHQKAGETHAEVNAIRNLEDESLIKNSTIYVSLEPCSHFGKTPPCADLIVAKGFKKVVIGMTDPHAKVKGKGIKKLFENGCHVTLGVCEEECLELNKRFITFHEKHRPYIILKWAESQDGYLSPFEYGKHNSQNPVWLTNSYSKQRVHQWRSQEQAIMIGKHTALMDNPSLTSRLYQGQNPLRVLIDQNLEVPNSNAIFSEDAKTLVFVDKAPENSDNHIDYVEINFDENVITQILKKLHQKNIQSIIVEGGRITLQHFIDLNLWDEARVFKSEVLLKKGTKAPEFEAEAVKTERILNDELNIYRQL
jgi:diaminohydroxyphosphoribosylaminopyrimidine deaminase/5-amino-6-(5-phosphoribosylamino)uracil reductase